MKSYWVSASLAAALFASGCGAMGNFDTVKQDFHYSYPLSAGGTLYLENSNGSVQVSGWDRDTIDISGTKYAPDTAGLNEVQVKASVHGSSATIETITPNHAFHGGNYGVSYVIRLPRKTVLEHLQTTNGAVSVDDLQGGGKVTSTNGRIGLSNASGDYTVQTTNGAINLDRCNGAFRAESSNGSIKGNLASGSISASTTNGPVNFTIEKPQDGQKMRATSTNGSITLAMAEFHDNAIHADTTNGSITLRVPDKTNAELDAHTNSSIKSDLAVTVSGEVSKRHLAGKIGQGGPLISAETSNGSIHLERY
jgi:hypothetical protein